MNNSLRLVSILLSSGAVLSCAAPAPIADSPTTPVPLVATVSAPFVVSVRLIGEAAPDVTTIIERDLTRSGSFQVLPGNQLTVEPSRQALDAAAFESLSALGLTHLIHGEAHPTFLRFHLVELRTQQDAIAFDVPVPSPGQLRAAAHQISDLVYRRLTSTPGLANTKIAYVAKVGGAQPRYRMIIAGTDGMDPQLVAESREPILSPAWSPDRRQLAFVGYERGRSAIYVQNLATGKLRRLVSEAGLNACPAWSRDGRFISYTLSIDGSPDIYIQDLNTGERRRFTSDPGIETEAAWSPDGRQIAFTSDRSGQPRVYLADVETGAARMLSAPGHQTMASSFSPDGKSIAMVANDAGKYRIALVNLETADYRYLSDGPADQSPGFAPNGTSVIFGSAGTGNRGEITIATLNGHVRERLRTADDIHLPAWSPIAPSAH